MPTKKRRSHSGGRSSRKTEGKLLLIGGNEDKTEDTSVSVADSSEINTGNVPIPEFSELVVPIFAIFALFIVVRRRRRN